MKAWTYDNRRQEQMLEAFEHTENDIKICRHDFVVMALEVLAYMLSDSN